MIRHGQVVEIVKTGSLCYFVSVKWLLHKELANQFQAKNCKDIESAHKWLLSEWEILPLKKYKDIEPARICNMS